MESEHHLIAMLLLYELVTELTRGREDVYVGADMVVYFSDLQVKNKDFRAPDLTVVTGVEPRERQGWIVWQEGGRYPELVVEHMSPSTRQVDLGAKLRVYGNIWHVSEYYAFDLETGELHAFGRGKDGLEKRSPEANGLFRSELLDTYFGVDSQGYRKMSRPVLRLFDAEGRPVLTGSERAGAEARRAEDAELRAAAEAQRATSLEAELIALKAKLGIT
jgi:Uma2 family endonuclease